jgi:hypothetical protein
MKILDTQERTITDHLWVNEESNIVTAIESAAVSVKHGLQGGNQLESTKNGVFVGC